MRDQHELWNNAHKKHWLQAHSQQQTSFAEIAQATIPQHSTVLELGCGEGNDAAYFASQGHTVVATDFSEIIIAQNSKRYDHAGLQFIRQDISQPLPFPDNSFDAVYARLSLHYFTDAVTRTVFQEIARVLKPGGALCCMCKSTADPIYGKGEKIETDLFELDGHIRHFFSEAYMKRMIDQADLSTEKLVSGTEMIYSRMSGYVQCIAIKSTQV